ncbi:MAG TPA: prepilin-type N-terminal cleavage/methylation domain-containing protein [Candidatus Binatia bacterium]|jgi:prepilin-type N-terminal cleavage/methylation domain-containing protein|nr:prepilin-type N-terminal cleavage/methylation domain-containing protein [Candidatus Binatia bacterium]
MKSKPSSRRSAADRGAGFSLIELLVTMGITGVVLTSVVQFFALHSHTMREHTFRIETQQALRGVLDAITRDARLAGACLPDKGQLVALSGQDTADGDSVTIRTGLVRNDTTCVRGTTNQAYAAGTSNFTVDNAQGFVVGQMAYVYNTNDQGELIEVAGVGATTVRLAHGTTQSYFSGATLYAVDERVYSIDTDVTPPLLYLTVNDGEPQPFAAGITELQVQYVLDRNCPNCDIESASTLTTPEWRLVNEVIITATAQTVGGVVDADQTELTQVARAKPRNLLP